MGFVAWSLYGAVVPVETYLFRMVHMAFIFALSFLVYPTSKKAESWTRWLDIGLAILGVATIAYALVDLDQFVRRSTVPEPADFWFGIAAIVLLVEISRRAVGMQFTWSWSGSSSTPTSATSSPARCPTRATTWTGSSATRT